MSDTDWHARAVAAEQQVATLTAERDAMRDAKLEASAAGLRALLRERERDVATLTAQLRELQEQKAKDDTRVDGDTQA